MTESEGLKVMTYLRLALPRQEIAEGTVAVYCDALRTVPYEAVMAAARTHVATSSFFPTIAELLKPIAEATVGSEPAEQAWLEVKRAISRWGRYQPWQFANPITTAAVEALGKESLCSADETLVAERAHFMRIYESYRQRELEGVRVAAVTGREYRSSLPAPVLALLKGGKGQ